MRGRDWGAGWERPEAPNGGLLHPAEDHPTQSRLIAAHLHTAYILDGPGSPRSSTPCWPRAPEFAELWREHPVQGAYHPPKDLMVFTTAPGTESDEKLRLRSVIGAPHV